MTYADRQHFFDQFYNDTVFTSANKLCNFQCKFGIVTIAMKDINRTECMSKRLIRNTFNWFKHSFSQNIRMKECHNMPLKHKPRQNVYIPLESDKVYAQVNWNPSPGLYYY